MTMPLDKWTEKMTSLLSAIRVRAVFLKTDLDRQLEIAEKLADFCQQLPVRPAWDTEAISDTESALVKARQLVAYLEAAVHRYNNAPIDKEEYDVEPKHRRQQSA